MPELNKTSTLRFKELICALRDLSGSGKDLANALRVASSTVSRWSTLPVGSTIVVKDTTILAIARLLHESKTSKGNLAQTQAMLEKYLADLIDIKTLMDSEIDLSQNEKDVKDRLYLISKHMEMIKAEINFCIGQASGISPVEHSFVEEMIKAEGKDPRQTSFYEYLAFARSAAILLYPEQDVSIQIDKRTFLYLKT